MLQGRSIEQVWIEARDVGLDQRIRRSEIDRYRGHLFERLSFREYGRRRRLPLGSGLLFRLLLCVRCAAILRLIRGFAGGFRTRLRDGSDGLWCARLEHDTHVGLFVSRLHHQTAPCYVVVARAYIRLVLIPALDDDIRFDAQTVAPHLGYGLSHQTLRIVAVHQEPYARETNTFR